VLALLLVASHSAWLVAPEDRALFAPHAG